MATGTKGSDPIRDLNNYLQGVKEGESLTKYLSFTSEQTGKNSEAVHNGTYTFRTVTGTRTVTIGKGQDTTKNGAKRFAAIQALEYFHANGIPE